MTEKEKWLAARVIYEGRKRDAWGDAAEMLISREPWQSHSQHPLACEDHLLALAQINALLVHYEISSRTT